MKFLVCECLAIEVLIDGDEESHDTLGIWDLDGQHVCHIQHLRNTLLSVKIMHAWPSCNEG